MRFGLFMLVAMLAVPAMGGDSLFYIGAFTRSQKSKGIYAGRIDTETGKLGPLMLAARAENPGYLAVSKDGKFVYATVESSESAVSAYQADGSGNLKLINTKPTGGRGVCHVSLDGPGRTALTASYGNSISALGINADGSLGDSNAMAQVTGSGPDLARQLGPHAHGTYSDETGRFVYACDLGTDNIWIFRVEHGALIPADPPSARVPPGSGPRHLAWHPNGKFAYVANEMALSVTAFARPGEGKLVPLQTIASLPEGVPVAGKSSAEIVCHPSGKWLFVSNRYHDSLTTFAIAEDGRLTWVEDVPIGVKTPRGFGLDPSGRWLIAAGQDDDRIAVLRIDPATGKATLTDQSAEVGSPACVQFAPAAK